jgi:hypothetical protein
MGMVVIALGIEMMDFVIESGTEYVAFAVDKSQLGQGVLVLGIFAVITGLFGVGAGRFQKLSFTIPFSLLSLVFGILLIIFGSLTVQVTDEVLATVKNDICAVNGTALFKEYNEAVNRFMCSDICPCYEGVENATRLKWNEQGNAYFLGFERATVENITNIQKLRPNLNLTPMIFTDNIDESFETWEECYTYKMKELIRKEPENSRFDPIRSYLENGGLDFLTFLEKEYECGGICGTAMIGIFQKVSNGPAT